MNPIPFNITKFFLLGCLAFNFFTFPYEIYALPSGGNIIQGNGSIQQPSSQELTVQQNSQKLITEWNSFGIGATESVQFIQPDINSVALNRVVGSDPSQILGKLSANGQVFLVNPSGVYFGPNSTVDAHGFIGSTLDLSNQDFFNNNYSFNQDPSKPLASIINQGQINGGQYAGLLAPAVTNTGKIIVADLGTVALTSGEAAVLDFSGDGLINFTITQPVSGEVPDNNGNLMPNRILNSGQIQANGGQVLLMAKDAGSIVRDVVNHSGIIEVNSVSEKNGRIVLSGGEKGIVNITGTLNAIGDGQDENGGHITIEGEQIGMFQSSVLNVSGVANGGMINIGKGSNGTINAPTAKNVYIGENIQLLANSLSFGEGGIVGLYAADTLRHYGQINAAGGLLDGNGGTVINSGKRSIEIKNAPDISAINGSGGDWLVIDADVIEILPGKGVSDPNGDPFGNIEDGLKLGADLILDAFDEGSTVFIATGFIGKRENGSLFLNAPIDYTGKGANSLILGARKDLFINESIFTRAQGINDRMNITLIANTDEGIIGTFNLKDGKNIHSNNRDIWISGVDFNSKGFINSGNARVVIRSRGVKDMFLGADSNNLGFKISDEELSKITADRVFFDSIGNIFFTGVQPDSTRSINKLFFFSNEKIVTQGEKSTFSSSVELNAQEKIEINSDLEIEGDLVANVQVGGVEISDDASVDAVNSQINENGSGNSLSFEERELVEQGNLSNFIKDFLENGKTFNDC